MQWCVVSHPLYLEGNFQETVHENIIILINNISRDYLIEG